MPLRGHSAPARRVGAQSAPVNPTGLRILSDYLGIGLVPGSDFDYHGPMSKRDEHKVSTGHRPHMTGGGIHADRRTRRLRTRAASKASAMKEW